MAEQESWGLSRDQRRMVLGIRAAGLLLVGLGLPILKSLVRYLWFYGYSESEGSELAWQLGTLFDRLRDKTVLVNLASSAGPFIAAIVFGVYLMRCDPRPLICMKGAGP